MCLNMYFSNFQRAWQLLIRRMCLIHSTVTSKSCVICLADRRELIFFNISNRCPNTTSFHFYISECTPLHSLKRSSFTLSLKSGLTVMQFVLCFRDVNLLLWYSCSLKMENCLLVRSAYPFVYSDFNMDDAHKEAVPYFYTFNQHQPH